MSGIMSDVEFQASSSAEYPGEGHMFNSFIAVPPEANWRADLLDMNAHYKVHSVRGIGPIRRFFWRVCFGVTWKKI